MICFIITQQKFVSVTTLLLKSDSDLPIKIVLFASTKAP